MNNLVTRFLGRLKVNHGQGTIEFELRNPKDIEKRGARVILRIHGLGDIPRFEDGMVIEINGTFVDLDGFITFRKDNEEVHTDGRGSVS